jgi:hypothetical protein
VIAQHIASTLVQLLVMKTTIVLSVTSLRGLLRSWTSRLKCSLWRGHTELEIVSLKGSFSRLMGDFWCFDIHSDVIFWMSDRTSEATSGNIRAYIWKFCFSFSIVHITKEPREYLKWILRISNQWKIRAFYPEINFGQVWMIYNQGETSTYILSITKIWGSSCQALLSTALTKSSFNLISKAQNATRLAFRKVQVERLFWRDFQN